MSKSSEVMNDRRRVQLVCDDVSMTQQNFAEECDIRNIMAKFKRSGVISHLTSAKEILGDYTEVPDYREALDTVIRAQTAFDELPADWRKRFNNDPAEFVDFVQNPANRDEMIKFGMIDPVIEDVPVSTKTLPEGNADPSST